MFGSHLDQAIPRQFEDGRNPSAIVPGIAACFVVWLVGLVLFGMWNIDTISRPVQIATVSMAGLITGIMTSSAIRRSWKRRAGLRAQARRTAEEARVQRQLEEARKSGTI